jgi:hypothetical protein
MKTTVILFFDQQEGWSLSRYKGDNVPTSTFATAKQAREFAKKKKWCVRRSYVSDYLRIVTPIDTELLSNLPK